MDEQVSVVQSATFGGYTPGALLSTVAARLWNEFISAPMPGYARADALSIALRAVVVNFMLVDYSSID